MCINVVNKKKRKKEDESHFYGRSAIRSVNAIHIALLEYIEIKLSIKPQIIGKNPIS